MSTILDGIEEFVAEIEKAGIYQDIELGHIIARGKSVSFRFWMKIKHRVDFRGKTVLDLGCNIGYFCFKARESGAKKVLGIDIDAEVIEIARKLRDYKGLDCIEFICGDVEEMEYGARDITLLINMPHNLFDNSSFMRKVFSGSKEVVCILQMRPGSDIPVGEIEDLDSFNEYAKVAKFADLAGFRSIDEVDMHYGNKGIAIFRKSGINDRPLLGG